MNYEDEIIEELFDDTEALNQIINYNAKKALVLRYLYEHSDEFIDVAELDIRTGLMGPKIMAELICDLEFYNLVKTDIDEKNHEICVYLNTGSKAVEGLSESFIVDDSLLDDDTESHCGVDDDTCCETDINGLSDEEILKLLNEEEEPSIAILNDDGSEWTPSPEEVMKSFLLHIMKNRSDL